jgi:hypothetical protein
MMNSADASSMAMETNAVNVSGSVSSTAVWSLLNRFRMRPSGVVSKKLIGDLHTIHTMLGGQPGGSTGHAGLPDNTLQHGCMCLLRSPALLPISPRWIHPPPTSTTPYLTAHTPHSTVR